MYVCMYVYMYVFIYIYICIYIYVCIYVCMYVCMYVCIHACIYIYIYIYIYVCVCMYVCMHACMYVCMYVYVCMHDVCIFLSQYLNYQLKTKTSPRISTSLKFISFNKGLIHATCNCRKCLGLPKHTLCYHRVQKSWADIEYD